MSEYPVGPTVNANMVQIASEHFKSVAEAREAIHRAVDQISDDMLRFARGIEVTVVA
jgi:hypothetical protein